MTGWHDIDSIPLGQRVEVLTYKGIVCEATTYGFRGSRYVRPATSQYPKRRVSCFRVGGGDVAAVAWRPLEATQ